MTQVGVVGADKGLHPLVCEAAGFRQSVEQRWDVEDAVSVACVRMLPGRRSAGPLSSVQRISEIGVSEKCQVFRESQR
eukprot:361794-Chlamydomonas_euryale.AAC.1